MHLGRCVSAPPTMKTDQAELRRVLSRQAHFPTVKVYLDGKWKARPLAEAREFAATRDYEFDGSGQRVRQMRLMAGRRFRTVDWKNHPGPRQTWMPVLQPSIEWVRSRRGA